MGGTAWRGWFPLGGELTSGVPDRKEGYYFGAELPPDPRPMHGANIWPAHPAALATQVADWMTAMEAIGQRLLALMAQGLGRAARASSPTGSPRDPTPLFRIFRYPPHPAGDTTTWGVGEHTDYGLLTLLATDGTPGLEVNAQGEWIAGARRCRPRDLQPRRHARSAHRWPLPQHAAPGAQPRRQRSLLAAVLPRPGWDASVEPLDFDDDWVAPADSRSGGTGPTSATSAAPTASGWVRRWPRCSPTSCDGVSSAHLLANWACPE